MADEGSNRPQAGLEPLAEALLARPDQSPEQSHKSTLEDADDLVAKSERPAGSAGGAYAAPFAEWLEITPNGLRFVVSWGGAPDIDPDIDPDKHRLVIHGLVK